MLIETPLGNYRWIENWVTIPESPLGKTNGRTHGAAVTKEGKIIIFHQADPAVLIYSPQGELTDAWGRYPGAHGITLVEENGVEYLWLADQELRVVCKTTLSGEVIQTLTLPGKYAGGGYTPTWVTVSEKRFGGNGDIWIADGYGAHLVHRFDEAGRHLQALDGTEGAGRFDWPHGITLDTRRAEPEIYIADRGKRRFQVYGLDGKFRRAFGEDFLTSPDGAYVWGQYLVVPELVARVTVLDETDRPIAILGANDDIHQQEGWPDNRQWLTPGKFNSPHGAAADVHGNIYVLEWITGGRITKLEKQAKAA